MPKFRLSATSASEGGRTVAEVIVDKIGREQALTEGIEELLLLPTFPLDAIQVYRQGLSRDFSRDEVCDVLLEKFALQFWCKEDKDEQPLPSVEARVAAAVAAAPRSAPQPAATNSHRLSPRQLLRSELKRLNDEVRGTKMRLDDTRKEYEDVKTCRDECRRMLAISPTPARKVTRGRTLKSV